MNYTKVQMQNLVKQRKEKTEKFIFDTFEKIFRKTEEQMTEIDKAFLRARQAYLTKAQKEDYKNILEPKKAKSKE